MKNDEHGWNLNLPPCTITRAAIDRDFFRCRNGVARRRDPASSERRAGGGELPGRDGNAFIGLMDLIPEVLRGSPIQSGDERNI